MKLYELLFEDDEALQTRFVNVYNRIAFGETQPEYAFLYQTMMKRFPKYRYSGRMFRVIGIRDNVFTSFSTKELLAHIKSESEQRGSKQVQSWSSTLKGVIKYLWLIRRSAYGYVSVIVEQQGDGFDVRKYSKDYKKGRPEGAVNLLAPSEQVHEILAPETSTIQIGGFVHAEQFYQPGDMDALQTRMTKREAVPLKDLHPKSAYADKSTKKYR